MPKKPYPGVFPNADSDSHRRQVSNVVNNLLRGRLNNIEDVTLTASVATTVVTDERVTVQSFIGFMPKTANAAAELAAGTMYVSSIGNGTFTITHANNAQTDRTFTWMVTG